MPQECFCFMQDKVLETQSSFSVSSVSLSSSASGIWSCAGWSAASSSEPKVQTPSAQQPGCSGSVLCGFLAVLRSLFCVGSFFRCVAETDIVIFVLVCAAASAFRQVVTVAGLVQSLVVCFFQCKYSCSRGCSCGCDHCSNDGSFHVDTSFLRHLVSVVIWKFCGSAAENTDVVYILIIPCFQRKYKPRHPEFWRLCGKNFQSGEDQTCSSACFRSAVISPMFSRPTEMRIRPPSMPAAFSCSSVSWR